MKRKRLAMLMAVVMTVTSVDGSMLLASAAEQPEAEMQMDAEEFTAEEEGAEEQIFEEAGSTENVQEIPAEAENAEAQILAEENAEAQILAEENAEAQILAEEEAEVQIFSEENAAEVSSEELFTDDVTELFSAGEEGTDAGTETGYSEITGAEISLSKLKYPAGLPISLVGSVILTYGDGSTETLPMRNERLVTSKGIELWNEIGYTTPEGGEVFQECGSAVLPEGEYQVRTIWSDGQADCEQKITVCSIEDSEVYYGQLTEEHNEGIRNPYMEYAYYKFVPSQSGFYRMHSTVWTYPDFYVWKDGIYEELEYLDNVWGQWELEAGTTYYLRLWTGNENDSAVNEIEFRWVPQVASITADVADEVTGIGLEFKAILANINITVAYTDPSLAPYTTEIYDYAEDDYGNFIRTVLKDAEGTEYDIAGILPEGIYTLEFVGRNVKSEPYSVRIISIEDSGKYKGSLQEGRNTGIQSPENDYAYYSFTPEKSGKYFMKGYENMMDPVYQSETGWEYAERDGACYKLDAEKTYYMGFLGSRWDDENEEYIETIDLDIVVPKEVQSITAVPVSEKVIRNVGVCQRQIYSNFTVVYEGGETKTYEKIYGGLTDDYGNNFWVTVKDENDQTCDDYEIEWLEPGAYSAEFTDGTVTASYSFTITTLDQAVSDTLDVGTQGIQSSSAEDYHFYRFTPETDGQYFFELLSENESDEIELTIYTLENGELYEQTSAYIYDTWDEYLIGGKTYFVRFRNWDEVSRNYSLTIWIRPELVSLKISDSEIKPATCVERIDIPELVDFTAELSYNDGTVKELRYRDGLSDDDENSLYIRCMRITEGEDAEEVNQEEPLPAGEYVYRIEVEGSSMYEDIPFTVVPLSQIETQAAVISPEQPLAVENTGDRLLYKFVSQNAGRYAVEFNVPVYFLRIFDKNGTEKLNLPLYEEGYEDKHYVNLEAKTEYYIATEADDLYSRVRVNVTSVNLPEEFTVRSLQKTYIAGLDHLNPERLETKIRYSDKTENTVRGQAGVQGAWLTYCAVQGDKTIEMGETLDTKGTYQVFAEAGTFSSGSAINAELADVKVNPAEITAEVPDIHTFPALAENVWEDLPNGSTRKIYSFTAEKAGTYALEGDETVGCRFAGFYLQGPERLEDVGTTVRLSAGESCAAVVYTYGAGKIRIVSTSEGEATPTPTPPEDPGDEGPVALTVGMKDKKILISSKGNRVACTFTPEESGVYALNGSSEDYLDTYAELYCGEEWLEENDDGGENSHFRLVYPLEAGKTYTYQVRMYNREATGSFYISFNKLETKRMVKIEAEADGREYNDLNNIEDVYGGICKITYEDGSTVELPMDDREDNWGNSFAICYEEMTELETDTDRTYSVYFEYKNVTDPDWQYTESKELKRKKAAAFEPLEEQKRYTHTLAPTDGNRWWYYRFTPKVSGEYAYKLSGEKAGGYGLEFYKYRKEGNKYTWMYPAWTAEDTCTVKLTAGETYVITIFSGANKEETSYIHYELKKAKELRDLEIIKLPDAEGVLRAPYDTVDLSGLTVRAAYKDNTTEEIAYGGRDSSGRSLTFREMEWLSDDSCRISVGLGGYRVSFLRKSASWSEVPEIRENMGNRLKTSVQNTNMCKFVPRQTGAYSFEVIGGNVHAAHILQEDLTKISDHTDDVYKYAYLEAGQIYYIPVWAEEAEITIRPVYDGCSWVISNKTEPTCTENGKLTEICTLHGDSRTTELPALGHDLKETVTEADCTENGSKVTLCSRCDYEETEIIPALGHAWSEWAVISKADCIHDGRRQRSCSSCRAVEEETIPALGHDFSGELQRTEPTDTENGREYYICGNGCGEEKTVKILPAANTQAAVEGVNKEVNSIKDAIENSGSTAKEKAEEINKAAEALIALDNEAILDSNAMDTVADVEKLVVEANEDIGETIVATDDADEALKGITVEGAALTAAGNAPEGSIISAKLTVERSGEDYSQMAPTTHALSISLSVVDDKGEIVESAVEPKAPLRITIPVPAAYQGKELELIHILTVGEEKVNKELTYVLNEDGTMMTFTTPSLSDFVMLVKDCGEGAHVFGSWNVTKPATCTGAGEQERSCTVCTRKETEILQATAHQFTVETEDRQAATCTEDGYAVRKCETCDQTKRLTEPALGHDLKEEITKEATCKEEGNKHITCTRCDLEENETIERIPHSFTKENVLVPATCVTEGSRELICENCGETVSSVIPADAAAHSFVWKTAKEATCGADGSRYQECEDCRAKGKTEVLKATGKHKYGAWTTVKAATALAAGTKQRTCTVCKAKQTAAIAKLKATMQLPVKAKSTLPLKVKKSVTIKVTGLAKGDKVASWTSSNKKIATVSKSGKITGKKSGTVKITVKLKSGLTQWFKVKVQKSNVKTKSVKLNVAKKITLKKGKSQKLAPVITPMTSNDKVTYKTSNKKVVTVSSKGVIKAKKKGKATITVKSGKKSAKVTVTVK